MHNFKDRRYLWKQQLVHRLHLKKTQFLSILPDDSFANLTRTMRNQMILRTTGEMILPGKNRHSNKHFCIASSC